MRMLRSALFNAAACGWTILLLLVLSPLLLAPRTTLLRWVHKWIRSLFWLQRHVLGLDFVFRGQDRLPDGPFIVAAAHQSAWDTIGFYAVMDDPAFVLKKELYGVPLFGVYGRRIGMVPIDRSGGAGEARRMIREVRARLDAGRPVIIFPGGTRSHPGEVVDLKAGVTALYRHCRVPVVPLSLNSGLYWGRRSFVKKPGLIIAEFGEPILPGLDADAFDTLLSQRIHDGNRRLLEEAQRSTGQTAG